MEMDEGSMIPNSHHIPTKANIQASAVSGSKTKAERSSLLHVE